MYSDGEALILARVRACTNFDTGNTARANWKLLNQGKARHYAILRPGAFTTEWITPNTYRPTWTTVIELWVRYKDDSETQTALYGYAADLLEGMQPSKRLKDEDGVVDYANIASSGEVQEMWTRGGRGPAWLKWELSLRWKEEIEVTLTN